MSSFPLVSALSLQYTLCKSQALPCGPDKSYCLPFIPHFSSYPGKAFLPMDHCQDWLSCSSQLRDRDLIHNPRRAACACFIGIVRILLELGEIGISWSNQSHANVGQKVHADTMMGLDLQTSPIVLVLTFCSHWIRLLTGRVFPKCRLLMWQPLSWIYCSELLGHKELEAHIDFPGGILQWCLGEAISEVPGHMINSLCLLLDPSHYLHRITSFNERLLWGGSPRHWSEHEGP